MNSRIQKFIEAEGLTAARFADAVGVQRSNVSHVLSGRNKPSFDFIEKMLLKYPALSSEWLILGKGSMYKESHMPSLFNLPAAESPDTTHKKSDVNPVEAGQASTNAQEQPTAIPDKLVPQNGKKLTRILLCYSDGSFEVFDSNASTL